MLDDASLLLAWERGYHRRPFEQALLLLGIANPNATTEDLMNLSIGSRDAALLSLRKRLFGSRMESLAVCPECGETVELSFNVDDVLVSGVTAQQAVSTELDGYYVEYRVPVSRDLAVLSRVPRSRRAEQLLFQCVSRVAENGGRVKLSDVPDETRDGIANAIADSDPQADIQLDLSCIQCHHSWITPFDIVSFLWTELSSWCQRLVAEIHLLAKAYGWAESEILSLSRWRRQLYVSMVRQ